MTNSMTIDETSWKASPLSSRLGGETVRRVARVKGASNALASILLATMAVGAAHAGPNDILKQNEVLRDGHALISNNGLFVAVLQADANFVVYRGTSVGDTGHGHLWAHDKNVGGCPCFAVVQGDGNFVVYRGTGPGDQIKPIWATNRYTHGESGPYFLIMQDDGNLVEYHGASQADQGGVQWASNQLDPLVGYDQIQDMRYQLDQAKVVKTDSIEIFNQTVKNDTDQTQTSTMAGNRSVSEQVGWSDTITNKIGIKDEVTVKIPIIGDNKIELSYEHESSHSTNGSVTTTKDWGFSTPISVLPHSSGRVVVRLTTAQITVPYQLSGSAVFQSGVRMPVNVSGIYTGTNAYDLQVEYTNLDSKISKIVLQKRLMISQGASQIVTKAAFQ